MLKVSLLGRALSNLQSTEVILAKSLAFGSGDRVRGRRASLGHGILFSSLSSKCRDALISVSDGSGSTISTGTRVSGRLLVREPGLTSTLGNSILSLLGSLDPVMLPGDFKLLRGGGVIYRDIGFYLIATAFVIVCGIMGKITWWTSSIMLAMYVASVAVRCRLHGFGQHDSANLLGNQLGVSYVF